MIVPRFAATYSTRLYHQFCELEALKAELLEEMQPTWDFLTSRSVFVQLPDSASEGSQGSV